MTNNTNSVAHESQEARAEPLETLDVVLYQTVATAMVQRRQTKGKDVAVIAPPGLDQLTTLAAPPDFPLIKHETLEAKLEFFGPPFDAQGSVKYGFQSEHVFSVVPEGSP